MELEKALPSPLTYRSLPLEMSSILENDRLEHNITTSYLLALLFAVVGLAFTLEQLFRSPSPVTSTDGISPLPVFLLVFLVSGITALVIKTSLNHFSRSNQRIIMLLYGVILIGGTTAVTIVDLIRGNDLSAYLLGILLVAAGLRYRKVVEILLISASGLTVILFPLLLENAARPSVHVILVYAVLAYWIGHVMENQRIENLLLTEKLRARNQELRDLSSTDALTGISNRRAFFEHTAFLMEQSKRYGSQLSIILMDIDRFKRVNDTLGHAVGDEVLIEFADLMKEATRSSDLFARYGGEEFILAMPHTRLEAAASTAERLRREIEQHRFSGVAWTITASLGVADFDPGEESLEETLIRADRAMYKVKDRGGNGVQAAG